MTEQGESSPGPHTSSVPVVREGRTMVDVPDGNETIIPAWTDGRLVAGTKTEQPPDLLLHLVHAGDGILTVEVADGVLGAANSTLLLAGRGAFEVTATFRRLVGERERLYLRLRPATPLGSGAA